MRCTTLSQVVCIMLVFVHQENVQNLVKNIMINILTVSILSIYYEPGELFNFTILTTL